MTVVVRASMSLDGYSAGPRVAVDNPLGDDGERLHTWLFPDGGELDPVDADAAHRMRAEVAATVLGRRTYDCGVGHWGDVPYPGDAFVLTHRPGPDLPMASGTFHFLDTGVADAITRARAAAGDREINLMGADVVRQALAAGLVDVLELQVVPLLLGAGERLLDGTAATLVPEPAQQSSTVLHVRYRVVR